jgi:hypothetical protein
MTDTRSQWNRFRAVSSAIPIPPAPTRPITADSRTLIPHLKRAIPQNAGATCGQNPFRNILGHDAPEAVRASIGPGSASSKASAKSYPTNPCIGYKKLTIQMLLSVALFNQKLAISCMDTLQNDGI